MSLISYALHLALIVSIFAIISLCASKITIVLGKRKTIVVGLAITVTGVLAMITTSHINPYLITLGMSIYCIGSAILYPVIFSQSLEIFPEMKGTSSSAIMSMRTLLMAALTGLTGLMYNGTALSIIVVLALAVTMIVMLTVRLLQIPLGGN